MAEMLYLFILFIYSPYKKADWQPKAEKHRFYKQKQKYMKNKLFTNIQAIERDRETKKAKYLQQSCTSHKQINQKIIIDHMNYIRSILCVNILCVPEKVRPNECCALIEILFWRRLVYSSG